MIRVRSSSLRRLKASNCCVRPAARSPARLDLGDLNPPRIVVAKVLREPIGVAENRGQQVVEVVCDAAGQLADGLHLLCLPQPAFHLPALGHVPYDGDKPVEPIHVARQRTHDDRADEGRAVRAAADAFPLSAPAPAGLLEEGLAVCFGQSEQRRRRCVLHHRGAGAEDVLGARRPRDDAAAMVEHEQRVVLDRLEHQAHPRLDLPQTAVGGLARAFALVTHEVGVFQ